MTNKSKFILLRRVLANAVMIISTVYFIHYVIKNLNEFPSFNWDSTSVIAATVSVTLVVVNIVLGGIIWQFLLRSFGISVTTKQIQIIFSIAQFGKYLPGNIGHHIGRVMLAKSIGIPMPITLGTMLLEVLWGIGIGLALTLLSFLLFFKEQLSTWHFYPNQLGILILTICLIFLPYAGIGFLNKSFPKIVKLLFGIENFKLPKLYWALVTISLYLLCFLSLGYILKLQAESFFGVTSISVLEFTCLFATVWLAGYLSPGAPGGLGIRETTLVLVLAPTIGPGTAASLGITLRITTMLGDAIAFMIGNILKIAK